MLRHVMSEQILFLILWPNVKINDGFFLGRPLGRNT